MYCPKCAAQNIDDAQFCRACGTNISLLPQALTGTLPEARSLAASKGSDRRAGPNLERGIKKLLMGFIFLILAISPLFSGHQFWWWMLFPAAPLLSAGIAELMSAKNRRSLISPANAVTFNNPSSIPIATHQPEIPARDTSELLPPPSVTEGTTRHLGSEAATQHFEINESSEKK